MRKYALAAALLAPALLAPPSPARAGDDDPPAVRSEVDEAVGRVYPTLVRIHVVWLDYGGGREQKYEASGSGAIISPEGLVVTNHHVAGRATLITCTLSDRQEVRAKLVGTDAMADIAVLKLDLEDRRDPKAPVPVAVFGDSDALRVGDPVLAMGCPLAISQSVTRGVVSNRDMMIPRFFGGSMEMDGENVGGVVKWIGHDAVIFPGNSGGPLVNFRGEIVGINEIGLGLGGAIPSNLAKKIVDEIVAHGEVRRSWLGVMIQPLLRASGLDRGVLLSSVVGGSPADRAGLRSGDVITSFDGQAVVARFDEEIPAVNRLFLETPVGREVSVTYLRAGAEATARMTTEARGKARGEEKEFGPWGITGRDITALAAIELQRPPNSGVRVSSLRDGGPAEEAKPPLQWGDILTEVDGKRIETIEDLARVTADLTKGKEEPVPTLVSFDRRRERLLTVVKVGPEPEDRSTEARKAWFPSAFQVLTTQLAEKLGLPGKKGVRVTQVYAGTTVEAAGIRVGDVLTALDGDEINASQPEDGQVFPHMVRARKIGSKVDLTVWREGKEITLPLELPARPPEGRELASYKDRTFDYTVREVSFKDRVDNKWGTDVRGVYVSAVESGGWAAFSGLGEGDLVMAVDGIAVETPAAVKERMAAVVKAKPRQVVFHVRRGLQSSFVEVVPAWEGGK